MHGKKKETSSDFNAGVCKILTSLFVMNMERKCYLDRIFSSSIVNSNVKEKCIMNADYLETGQGF